MIIKIRADYSTFIRPMTTKLGTPRGVDSLATNKSSASDVITLKSNDFKNLL